jgi:hypothetical protein
MPDSMPNYKLSQQKLISQIASIRENVGRQKMEMAEMIIRGGKLRDDIADLTTELEASSDDDSPKAEFAVQRKRKLLEVHRTSVLELADRMDRYIENRAASGKAISKYENDLASLEETHGKVTQEDIDTALTKLLGGTHG